MAVKFTPGSKLCTALLMVRGSASYEFALSCNVSDTCGVFRYCNEVALLPSQPRVRYLGESECGRLWSMKVVKTRSSRK